MQALLERQALPDGSNLHQIFATLFETLNTNALVDCLKIMLALPTLWQSVRSQRAYSLFDARLYKRRTAQSNGWTLFHYLWFNV